jgi:hemerythrin-like domain-containing protein
MLRNKNLIPLSRQHQHALALCVRIDRALQAGDVELEPWLAELQHIYEQEIGAHFAAEEKEIFPKAAQFAALQPIVDELLLDHAVLREYFVKAATRAMTAEELKAIGEKLAAHIRKEERQLFEGMQKEITPQELLQIGAALEQALKDVSQACLLPTTATRLRAKTEIE